MKILLATNMYPTKSYPMHGIFIKEHVDILMSNYNADCLVVSGGIISNRIMLKLFNHLVFFLKLIYHRITSKYDLIHTHYIYPTGFIVAICNVFSKKKLILTVHGSDIHDYHDHAKIKQYFIRFTICKADKIIAVSESIKKKIIEASNINSSSITIINMGYNEQIFYCKDLVIADLPIILFVGRLIPVKGFNYLIDAIKTISDQVNITFKCIVIGDGICKSEYYDTIKIHGLSKYFEFLGMLDRKAVAHWMNKASVLVVPSINEGFGLVSVEALACGTPVIASNVGGLSEIIIHENNGFLVKSKSPSAIAEYLNLFVNDNYKSKLQSNCINSSKRYHMKDKVQQLYNIYTSSC